MNHADERISRLQRIRRLDRRVILALAALIIAIVAATTVSLGRDRDNEPAALIQRSDPMDDLLGWLPANDVTRAAFAVWTGETGGATPTTSGATPYRLDLGITPLPRTLGLARTWREDFGYGASDITAWAAAGTTHGGTAVLAGDFDLIAIRASIEARGYQATDYHGAQVYVLYPHATPAPTVGGDSAPSANAIGILADRIITSASAAGVQASIDAAHGRIPSLADDEGVATLTRTLTPLTGLMAIDVAGQALACAGEVASPPTTFSTGRYVAVGYRQSASEGEPLTLVAVSFADEATAIGAEVPFEAGWRDGQVRAGAVVAEITSFGRVVHVSRSGTLLVTELADGRVEGWVPAAIRFADPVCDAVIGDLPSLPSPATPEPSASSRASA